MDVNRRTFLIAALVLVGLIALMPIRPALAVIIFSNTAGSDTLGGFGYEGHSFTMPPGNAYNSLGFSWVSSNHVTPLAAGNLFLLSQEYLSSPANLSAATPGYIAQSTGIAASAYVFSPPITLSPSIQYWVYMGSANSLAGGGYSFDNPFPSGKAYEQFNGPTGNYFNNGSTLDFNFILSGNPVPEPSTSCMAAFWLLAPGWLRRR